LVIIATAVRRYKSEANLSLGAELGRLILVTQDTSLAERLRASTTDIRSITRARAVRIEEATPAVGQALATEGPVAVYLTDE